MVVMYDGKVIQTYFASSAGGYTEDIEKVWLSDAVPLKGVPSPYDAYSGNYSSYGASCWSWTATYTPEELVSRANSYGKTDIGDYVGISMSTTYKDQTSVSGRAMIVTITGTKGSVSATKDNIRSLLNLKSTLISIEDNTSSPVAGYVLGAKGNLVAWESFDGLYGKSSSKSDKANGSNGSIYVVTADGKKQINKNTTYSDEIVIKGYGYGHGVGMSQWGAIAMGDDGWTWDDIIEHYYCHAGIELVSYYE